MKIQPLSLTFHFDELTSIFVRGSGSTFTIIPEMGQGTVQIFHLARGLEARFWNCSFSQPIELNGRLSPEIKNRHFTLLCFLKTEGLRLYCSDTLLKEDISWNTVFLSAKSNYKLLIPAFVEGQCLSISFTKTWLEQNVLRHNESFQGLRQDVSLIDDFSLVGTMENEGRKSVEDLFKLSWKKAFGNFYIKSAVLKIVSDFLNRIKERDKFSVNQLCQDVPFNDVHQYIRRQFPETIGP